MPLCVKSCSGNEPALYQAPILTTPGSADGEVCLVYGGELAVAFLVRVLLGPGKLRAPIPIDRLGDHKGRVAQAEGEPIFVARHRIVGA
jgi:hypothetical protein